MKYIDFYKFLFEAPIGNYTILKDPGEEDSFSPTDKALISNSENIQKIHQFFKNTPYIFDLYFYNNNTEKIQNFLGNLKYGETSFEELEQKYNISIPKPPNPETITVIFVSNYGNKLAKLTPWIIAHRISHVCVDNSDLNQTAISKLSVYIRNAMIKTFKNFYDHDNHHAYFNELFDYNAHTIFSQLYPYIFTFKSAREKNLANIGEMYPELFAQYIKNGTVEFIFPDSFKFFSYTFTKKKEHLREIENARLQIIKQINSTMEMVIKDMQGKIYMI